jgi:hypothetical protein
MTKEEVLYKFYTREMSEPYGRVPFDVIYKAMQEYAKQECVEFAKWLADNGIISYFSISTFSTQYQKFLENKNK